MFMCNHCGARLPWVQLFVLPYLGQRCRPCAISFLTYYQKNINTWLRFVSQKPDQTLEKKEP